MNWNERFYYDNGNLYYKINIGKHKTGKLAGSFSGIRYHYVEINQKNYLVHRIIWEMFNGPIPENYTIDHINGNASDNRIENLRLATMSQNCDNRNYRSDNKSGAKGVYWCKRSNKWRALLQAGKKKKSLGYYSSVEEASKAYDKAVKEFYGEFSYSVSNSETN